jgi:hypothetical protein
LGSFCGVHKCQGQSKLGSLEPESKLKENMHLFKKKTLTGLARTCG